MQGTSASGGLIARAANRHLGKSDREAAGVLSAAQRHTHFLVLPPDRLATYSRWLHRFRKAGRDHQGRPRIHRSRIHERDKKDSNLIRDIGDRPSVQEAYAKHKAGGEELNKQVLADPAGIYKLVEQIKANRPEVSLDGVIGLMIAELGNRTSRQAASAP